MALVGGHESGRLYAGLAHTAAVPSERAPRAERAERAATVSLPGGDLIVRWDESDHIWMTGPAETNFTGVFDPETGRFSINDAAA